MIINPVEFVMGVFAGSCLAFGVITTIAWKFRDWEERRDNVSTK